MRPLRWPQLGTLREASILLPTAVLLLVSVSTFTLFSARQSVELLVEARRGEAEVLARRIARLLNNPARAQETVLAESALVALRAAVVDADGRVIVSRGEFDSALLLAPIEDAGEFDALAVGPTPLVPEAVAGFARFVRRGEVLTVRVDLSAAELVAQRRAIAVLTWVALPLNALVFIFVLLYLARSLKPYEQLLSRARQADVAAADPAADELEYLLETFESAVAALARSRQEETEEDIASLQRALAPSLESGVLLLDPQAAVLALNPFGASILGIEAVPRGEPVGEVLRAQPALAERLLHAVDRRTGIQREEVSLAVGGADRILGLTVHPLRRGDGSIRGYLALFVDLTEVQRQAEEERISRTLEQLAELAAGIAHELRNGIATLLGYLTLIERRPDRDTVAGYLSEIRRESERMERVLKDFLTFATPGSLQTEAVVLAELVQRAAADPILAGCDLRLNLAAVEGLTVEVDPQLIEQALRNLLKNAQEAQVDRAAAIIEVTARRQEDRLELVIDDRGPGIPDAVRDQLFQPFVSGRHDGVGLGLSLTHRIASLHGGGLRFDETASAGTRAVLILPADRIVTE